MIIDKAVLRHLHDCATALVEARKQSAAGELSSDAYNTIHLDHMAAFGPVTCVTLVELIAASRHQAEQRDAALERLRAHILDHIWIGDGDLRCISCRCFKDSPHEKGCFIVPVALATGVSLLGEALREDTLTPTDQ